MLVCLVLGAALVGGCEAKVGDGGAEVEVGDS